MLETKKTNLEDLVMVLLKAHAPRALVMQDRLMVCIRPMLLTVCSLSAAAVIAEDIFNSARRQGG